MPSVAVKVLVELQTPHFYVRHSPPTCEMELKHGDPKLPLFAVVGYKRACLVYMVER